MRLISEVFGKIGSAVYPKPVPKRLAALLGCLYLGAVLFASICSGAFVSEKVDYALGVVIAAILPPLLLAPTVRR